MTDVGKHTTIQHEEDLRINCLAAQKPVVLLYKLRVTPRPFVTELVTRHFPWLGNDGYQALVIEECRGGSASYLCENQSYPLAYTNPSHGGPKYSRKYLDQFISICESLDE